MKFDLQYDVYNQISKVCPKVCGHFKNRANKLLEIAHDIYKSKRIDYFKKCVQDIEDV